MCSYQIGGATEQCTLLTSCALNTEGRVPCKDKDIPLSSQESIHLKIHTHVEVTEELLLSFYLMWVWKIEFRLSGLCSHYFYRLSHLSSPKSRAENTIHVDSFWLSDTSGFVDFIITFAQRSGAPPSAIIASLPRKADAGFYVCYISSQGLMAPTTFLYFQISSCP